MDYEAKVEAMEQRVAAMESDIKEIKSDVKNMPEQIADRLNDSIDMKIKLAIAETEKKYQAKFISMLLAIIAEGVGLIISFVTK
jgi:hypothetical protein